MSTQPPTDDLETAWRRRLRHDYSTLARWHRLRRGYRMSEYCEIVGVYKQALHGYEAGEVLPRRDTHDYILGALARPSPWSAAMDTTPGRLWLRDPWLWVDWLDKRRRRLGISESQLGRRMGRRETILYRWLERRHPPGVVWARASGLAVLEGDL